MAPRSRTHVAVLVDPARPRMRVVELEQRSVEHSELAVAVGEPGAWKCAPTYWEAPDRAVHLLVPGPDAVLPAEGWQPDHDLSRWAEATAAWLRSAHAAWRGGTSAVAGQAWWSHSWQGSVLEWVDAVLPEVGLTRTGWPVPTKLWSLSAVLRIPVQGAGGARDLWFKATCEGFRSEPTLTAAVATLAPSLLPRLVGMEADRAWMLMEPLPLADTGPTGLAVPVAGRLARLQLTSSPIDLQAAGVPVRSLATLAEDYRDALHRSVVRSAFPAERWRTWASVEEWVVAQVGALDELGLPLALNHGDLHLGNVAGDAHAGPVVYDWTDACLTHPYLDAAHLAGDLHDPQTREQVWGAWLQPWRAAYPSVDHDRARALAAPVEMAFQVVTFERIFRAQDAASRGDLLLAVPWLHDRLVAAHAEAG